MFVSSLNKDQQGILLSFAEQVVCADGVITTDEKILLDSIVAQCSPTVKKISVEVDSLSTLFNTQQSKVSLLLELIGLAYADEEYHESERSLIKIVAKALDIESDLLEEMESWVARQFILIHEAKTFMEEV
ncbi:TerB family tellurite resistance protein [Thalassolituus oleivorans]|jgi:uncharacterized tellurite resistance protein B-like protein|uniref:TerB family tellurite resistance protein n=1 Tax=Thalassolituus oleivorans TaxID=187493 RepID=UPI0023EFC43F|nr:TerB family tellurite resistance protein [Thalassolituus oleivorans]